MSQKHPYLSFSFQTLVRVAALSVATLVAIATGATASESAQPTSGVITLSPRPIQPEAYVRLTPDGTYIHDFDVRVTLVQVTERGLILECLRPSNVVYAVYRPDGKTVSPPPSVWREVYEIRDGRLALDRIQFPKITPASEERREWGNDDVVIPPR